MKEEEEEIKNIKLYILLGPLYFLRVFLNYSSHPEAEWVTALGVQDSYNHFRVVTMVFVSQPSQQASAASINSLI